MKSVLSIERHAHEDGLHCPHCDATLPAHAHFCASCGSKLDKTSEGKRTAHEDGLHCPHCDATLPAHAHFCASCGSKLDKTSEGKRTAHEDSLHCPHCDATLPTHAHFCASCGRRLSRQRPQELDTKKLDGVLVEELETKKLSKPVEIWPIFARWGDIAAVALPLAALLLWSLSLHSVDVGHMNDLGLVSVLPASIIIALVMLSLSFVMVLTRQKLQAPVILLHLGILIFMLYGLTIMVEQAPRFAEVYRHAGYTDFISRTGSVDPNLDAYYNWPGFFILSALLDRAAGFQDILPYAVWSPVYFNVIYLAPMYAIFTTATSNKRIIWLALWFFCVSNWIAQDYFSPQGLNYFFYLVIIAILLKWFMKPISTHRRTWRWQRRLWRLPLVSQVDEWLTCSDPLLTPARPRQRLVLLACVVAAFAFSVFTHPLTPFFIITSVGVLAIFGRITPRWLPVLLVIILAAWSTTMAQVYFVANINQLIKAVGSIGGDVSVNVTSRVAQGSPGHTFISDIRLYMTFFVWALAFAGALRRLRRGYHDANFVLLATVLFPLVLVQDYGGEMLLRIYLFSLPPMVFFAASLFFSMPARGTLLWKKAGDGLNAATALQVLNAQAERDASSRHRWHVSDRGKTLWMQLSLAGICLVLLGGFLFTRYGNERQDYMTNAEVAGVRHLYAIAPRNSLLMTAWDGAPWEAVNYEQYDEEVLYDNIPQAVVDKNVLEVVQFIENIEPSQATKAYLIVTRSQRATAELAGYPPGLLDQFIRQLQKARYFKLIYSNTDAQIYIFTP